MRPSPATLEGVPVLRKQPYLKKPKASSDSLGSPPQEAREGELHATSSAVFQVRSEVSAWPGRCHYCRSTKMGEASSVALCQPHGQRVSRLVWFRSPGASSSKWLGNPGEPRVVQFESPRVSHQSVPSWRGPFFPLPTQDSDGHSLVPALREVRRPEPASRRNRKNSRGTFKY